MTTFFLNDNNVIIEGPISESNPYWFEVLHNTIHLSKELQTKLLFAEKVIPVNTFTDRLEKNGVDIDILKPYLPRKYVLTYEDNIIVRRPPYQPGPEFTIYPDGSATLCWSLQKMLQLKQKIPKHELVAAFFLEGIDVSPLLEDKP